MLKKILVILSMAIIFSNFAFAHNLSVVKNMYTNVIEANNADAIPKYFATNFTQSLNWYPAMNYDAFKRHIASMNKRYKSVKIEFEGKPVQSADAVVTRYNLTLVTLTNQALKFKVIAILHFKNNKIVSMWQVSKFQNNRSYNNYCSGRRSESFNRNHQGRYNH
ncbi:MAG: hypothetical protein COB50_03485 [Thiotrichales bacterium]|nr:MAG: hypothetical protein COB50_03485 [Thiotrichales bacterium]